MRSTSSSLDKRQHDRDISFHQLPEGDVPLYQEAERVQWDERVTHGSVQIHSPAEATKVREQVPENDACTQDLRSGMRTLVCWILPVTPCP